jgi:hypothetical protein
LNTELQNQLLKLSEAIANTATGGDSFCYMQFEGASLGRGSPIPWFTQQGQYPLYDVGVRIADVDASKKAQDERKSHYMIDFLDMDLNLQLGNLAKDSSLLLTKTPFTLPSGLTVMRLNIFFTARNGSWTQFLRAHLIDKKWQFASKVVRGQKVAGPVLYLSVDKKYPRGPKGTIDW